MLNFTESRDTSQAASAIEARSIDVGTTLRPYVSALLAAELHGTGPLPLSVAPHESLMLAVQLGRAADGIERKGVHGENTSLTGIRQQTHEFIGAGDCVTLFALLTPLGAVQLLDSQPLALLTRGHARVDELLDRQITRGLESDIALAHTLDDKLHAFGAWLEARACAHRQQARAAMRAGMAAMRVRAEPGTAIETLADEQHVSRRQLERDFGHWIGTSPRHFAQVARVQAFSRKAQAGGGLADISAELGFADQAHMSRVVRQLSGLTPKQFARTSRTPLATAFRRATGGATVYL